MPFLTEALSAGLWSVSYPCWQEFENVYLSESLSDYKHTPNAVLCCAYTMNEEKNIDILGVCITES